MSASHMLKDRNGPAKVAQMQKEIDETFSKVSSQLYSFHKMMITSKEAGSVSVSLTPANKIKLYNEFYRVANTHPSVAAEFVEKLRKWSADHLVPEYKATIEHALASGDEDTIFHAVSSNFQCFSLVTKVTSTIFHNVNNQLAESPSSPKIAAPKQVLFSAYREHFYDRIRPKIQAIFFKRVSEVRKSADLQKLTELRPISEIFAHVARSTSASLDETAARVYQKDYVERYLERLVEDNKAAVREQQSRGVPANEIAKWINNRADFEETLLRALVAPENNLHNAIMVRYDDDVVATCTIELVKDNTHGFSASFRAGDKTEESFRSAIDLFEISARVERKHPRCVQECVKEFRTGCTDRLNRLIMEARSPVFDNGNSHADSFVKQLLEEYHLMERTVKRMRNHVDLVKANSECYKLVLNSEAEHQVIVRKVKRGTGVDERKTMFCEVLATFVDLFLSADQSASMDEAQAIVKDIGVLFSFVADRDIFGEHYKLRLAKRLLLTKYKEDMELQVLEQMQRQSGKHFIHKFEGMINDVRVAENIQRSFRESNPRLACEFDVKVLTYAFWPQIKPDDNFVVPESLAACQEGFTRYYRRQNPTKQLRWQAERSTAVLDVAYTKGVKELSMSVMQAAVMIVVDTVAPQSGGIGISVTDVAKRCGMNVKETLPTLASMIFAKGLQLLRRVNVSQTAKLEEGNTFEMNPEYAVKMRKLKLPHAASSANPEPTPESIDPIIEASRAQMLDAAIVRIMKARKQMNLVPLVELTIQAVLKFFPAQPRQIKKRIEELIAKEFLERDSSETDLFKYLA